jgi:hypothetical protein
LDHSEPSKYLARKKNYPGKSTEEVNLLEFELLEAEIKDTLLGTEGILVRFDNKIVVFYQKGDAELFQEILRFKRTNPLNSSSLAISQFVQWEQSDVIVDILYEQNFQSCLTYQVDQKDIVQRFNFMTELIKRNLILVFEISIYNPKDRFVLLYSSFETNAREAERLQFRFQLTSECIKKHIPEFNEVPTDLKMPGFWGRSASTKVALEFYNHRNYTTSKRSVPFTFAAISDFKGGDVSGLGNRRVKEHFFSAENKNQLLHSIVASCYLGIRYHNSKRMTINELLDSKVFSGYYALHDDSVHRLSPGMKEAPNTHGTKLFLKMWAEKISLHKLPLSEIQMYFGESIGFYFGWLEFYTKWFMYLAVIGIVAFIYGIIALFFQKVKAITVFDNEATPIFAFIISVWSLLFLKYWKRRAHHYSFVWDTDNFDKVEVVRIQHVTSAVRISPITGKKEEYEPANKKRMRKFVAGSVMTLAFLLLCGVIAGNIAFAGYMEEILSLSATSGIITSSVFNVLQILVVAPLYNSITMALNKFENYKTNTAYLSNY